MTVKEILAVDEEKVNDFKKKIIAICEEYDYAACYMVTVFKPENPTWDMTTDRSWLIDDSLFTSKEYEDLGTLLDEEKEELPTEDRIKLMDFFNNLLIVQRQMALWCSVSHPLITNSIETLTNSLGLDTSRIIPIKPNVPYTIYTVADITYELQYDKNRRYFLKQIGGENKDDNLRPGEALALIGCLQSDGELFGLLEVPAISTGDKMMFQLYPFHPEKGITTDTFLTAEVIDVVRSDEVN